MLLAITFAAYWVPESVGVKREVRCNSGAIPVAVSSLRESSIISREYFLTMYATRLTPVESSYHCSAKNGKVFNTEQARRPATYK